MTTEPTEQAIQGSDPEITWTSFTRGDQTVYSAENNNKGLGDGMSDETMGQVQRTTHLFPSPGLVRTTN